jgi:type IV fimbrial biogenesis protein FimT
MSRFTNFKCQATQRGFSMIEHVVALSVISTVLGAVAPAFDQARDRQSLRGAASQLRTEIQWARSTAVARNERVRFTFQTGVSSSCYVVHTGNPGQCTCEGTEVAVCSGDAKALRTVVMGPDSRTSARANSSFAFDPHLGTVTPTATIELRSRRNETVRLVVNIMGRVRACTTTADLDGYPAC